MKILIVGSTGLLGSDCKEVFSRDHELMTPGRKELDIISWDGVIENLQNLAPEVVINCAGFNQVDACETEEFKVSKINVEGPRNLAQCATRYECRLVHISSDYVFDGQKMLPQPYFEDDFPNPISRYGKSKKDSEIAVRDNSPNYIIVRTSWLYGLHGNCFIKWLIGSALSKKKEAIRLVEDQFGSPTWSYRVAMQINELLEKDCRGTYHATAEGYCNFVEYGTYVLDRLGLKAEVVPCKMEQLNRPAKRPANCLLENRRLKKQGINFMVDWKADVDTFLDTWGDNLIKEAEEKK